MNLKLLVGIALFLLGIVLAVIGIGTMADGSGQSVVGSDETVAVIETSRQFAVPIFAGLALAVGGLLIGLSMGNWTRPRTHLEPGDEVVNPEGYHKMKHV